MSYKKFIYDFIRCFVIFYFTLILFWIDAHQNIFSLPYNIIVETLSSNFWTGWPYNLVNGNYYISNEIPKDTEKEESIAKKELLLEPVEEPVAEEKNPAKGKSESTASEADKTEDETKA